MKKIKMYLLFTGWRYKLGIFLGLPLAALALGLLWNSRLEWLGYGYMLTAVLIFFEVIADQAVFAGIQSKRGYKLDYLKTSPLGHGMLRCGLVGDLVRRFLTAALCVGICGSRGILKTENSLADAVGILLTIYFTETLTLFLSRYVRSAALCVCIAYGGITVGAILLSVINTFPAWGVWLADILLTLGAVAVSVLTVRTAMKKWRRTFSDM